MRISGAQTPSPFAGANDHSFKVETFGLLRHLDRDLNRAVPSCQVLDVVVRQLLRHDAHHLVSPLAASKRLQLDLEINLAFARKVRCDRKARHAIEAMTDLALLFRQRFARGRIREARLIEPRDRSLLYEAYIASDCASDWFGSPWNWRRERKIP